MEFRFSFTLLLLGLWINPFTGNSQEFKPVFGEDYENAVAFVHAHKDLLRKTADELNADPNVVASLIFPELIRYSRLRDFFETQSLELAYVKWGPEYADFSIGRFQMKPSFVEKLETYLRFYFQEEPALFELAVYADSTAEAVREVRLSRLRDLEWQIRYACGFYRILTHKFPQLLEATPEERIKFAAAAYNHGFSGTEEEIRRWIPSKNFPYGTLYPGKQHAYSEIAADYFRTYCK